MYMGQSEGRDRDRGSDLGSTQRATPSAQKCGEADRHNVKEVYIDGKVVFEKWLAHPRSINGSR